MSQTQVLAAPAGPLLDRIARPFAPFAEPLVRATIGLLLVPHGAQKLFGLFGGYGLEATGQFFATKLGLPASLALVAGLMFVAAFKVHLGAGFFWTAGGYEYPLMWGLVALAFVLQGGGRYSLDALIFRAR